MKRGVFVWLDVDWFSGLTTRASQEQEQNTHSVKLPLDAYSMDLSGLVGAKFLLE